MWLSRRKRLSKVLAAQRTVHAADADDSERDVRKGCRVLVDNNFAWSGCIGARTAELAPRRVNLAPCRQQRKSEAALADITRIAGHLVKCKKASPWGHLPTDLPQTTPYKQSDCGGAARTRGRSAGTGSILDRPIIRSSIFNSSCTGRGSGWDPAGNFEEARQGLARIARTGPSA